MNIKYCVIITCLLWLSCAMGRCGETEVPEVTTIHRNDGTHYMKVCNIANGKVTVLVVSIGSKGHEITLPKFGFEMPRAVRPPKVADLESRMTYVNLIENGPNVLESGKWFIVRGERTLASGDIHFGKEVAREIMMSSQSLERLTVLLKTKQSNVGK